MKKILAIITVAACVAGCGSGNSEAKTGGEDSTKKAFDSIQQTGDTTPLNKMSGDTTSKMSGSAADSGTHTTPGNAGGTTKKGGK